MAKDSKPERKEYSLKDIEIQMMNTINGQAQTAMSNFVSYILMERMAYAVTPNSRFEIDFVKKTVQAWEELPAEEPKAEVIK